MPSPHAILDQLTAELRAADELRQAQRDAAGGSFLLDGPGQARGLGGMADAWAERYPDLDAAHVHAIRKHGEDHGLSEAQVQLEFERDTRTGVLPGEE